MLVSSVIVPVGDNGFSSIPYFITRLEITMCLNIINTVKARSTQTLAVAIVLLVTAATAWGQAGTGDHSLDGTSVDWTYNNSEARMVVSFSEGLGQYEWIAGGRTGNSDSAIPYSAREISPDIFLMSWIQAGRPDFITMIFDFNAMTVATTGLIGYGSDNERMLFMDGVINGVER